MRHGGRAFRRGEPAAARRGGGLGVGVGLVQRQGAGHRHVARRPLLQQQLGRLDDGFRVEPCPHDAVQDGVRDGDDGHALVVRHERTHHGSGLAGWNPAGRVVERLIEPVAAEGACPCEPGQVIDGRGGIDHGGQGGRVGCDDQVRLQAALQPQTGDAKIGILVGVLDVADIVGGFRHAPGHVMRRPVVDLPPHDEPARVLQQAAVRRAHHQ